MTEFALKPLIGTNPLGVLAALGAFDVAHRLLPDIPVTLHWSGGLIPHPVLSGPEHVEHLIALIDTDRQRWASSTVLTGPAGEAPSDLKLESNRIRDWIQEASVSSHPEDLKLLHALVSEDAVAGTGDSKPTHLHFTAGQQKFLSMVRILNQELTVDQLREALIGPWRYESELPVLGWDSRGERIYALRGFSPSGDKKTGVPGADWLGFLGLRFFPVATTPSGALLTSCCSRRWKTGTLTWPLWDRPLSERAIVSMLAGPLTKLTASEQAERGIATLLTAPIRRTDQGGYGSFGPSAPATTPTSARRSRRIS